MSVTLRCRPMSTDPLGLTAEQRTMSNIHAGLSRRPLWWPPAIDPRVAGNADASEPDDSINLIAEVLHRQGLELAMQLVPR